MSKVQKIKKTLVTNHYDPKSIELKWQSKWEKEGLYQPDMDNAKKPFYNLMMFPYPSAEGLHIGGIYTFSGVDAYGRFKRMQGNDVFEPMGLDGFGIHSENHALKTGDHPMEHAKRTEENFYRQLREIGNGYAWDHKVETYDPAYYKWTQWLFVELFKAGLAYKKQSPVNFCPSCKTVLADEQVIDGKCERCNSVVEKRDLKQWFFRITNYSERLLNNIEDLNWSDKVRTAQRNWIGKSEGVFLNFKLENTDDSIRVFTTAIDTVYGTTFLVISPEHPLAAKIVANVTDEKVKADINNYIEQAKNKSEQERLNDTKEKTGIFTTAYVINPFNNEQVPVWIADYVLSGYGTGAVMGVPGHDSRDHEFAKKFGLAVKPVVKPTTDVSNAHVEKDGFWDYKEIKGAFKDKSELINSGVYDGLSSKEAKPKFEKEIAEKGWGEKTATYHLRDWLISRQRYWGPPIPMIYCEACAKQGKSWFDTEDAKTVKTQYKTQHEDVAGWYPSPDLPVKLPYVEDYKPLGTGKSPLGNYPEFYETTCPGCGTEAIRETDVSDTFLDSAWYFLRYPSTDFNDRAFDEKRTKKWLPVTIYIGGAEHSVLHLLYARFTTMVLHDLGYLDFEEPFSRFYAHGLIIKDGAKMSKSKGNVINPDEYIAKYGADAVRCYLMFLGPFNQGGDFRDTGMEGMHRFIKRVWTLLTGKTIAGEDPTGAAKSMLHETVKAVSEEMEHIRFNTSLAKLMTWYNFLAKQDTISKKEITTYLQLLAPFAPHMTEELWHELGQTSSIHTSEWPSFDEDAIVKEQATIAIQVNGKLRGTLEISMNEINDEERILKEAVVHERVKPFVEGKTIRKQIYIPGKIVNIVVS